MARNKNLLGLAAAEEKMLRAEKQYKFAKDLELRTLEAARQAYCKIMEISHKEFDEQLQAKYRNSQSQPHLDAIMERLEEFSAQGYGCIAYKTKQDYAILSAIHAIDMVYDDFLLENPGALSVESRQYSSPIPQS